MTRRGYEYLLLCIAAFICLAAVIWRYKCNEHKLTDVKFFPNTNAQEQPEL